MQAQTHTSGYRFDDFYLDVENRELRREGRPLALNSKYFDVLLLLVSRAGRLVEKQRIFDEVWSGVFVTDAALTQCIKDIRRQLGDDAANPRYIKTVPKHGYIFIGNLIAAREDNISPTTDRTAARPYKFLDYFTEADAQLFFGREQEAAMICSQVLARRSFILHGRSGVGKSSIIRAGVIPRLKADGHLAFALRSFTDPLHQMASALVAQTVGLRSPDVASSEDEQASNLAELIRQAGQGRMVIFFFDQFEEFFTSLDEQAREHFILAAGRLAADESLPLRLVFVLREDMLAEMSRFKSAIPEIFHHEYRLKRLSRHQAARAITEPAARAGCRIEPQLVERLLDDLTELDGIDPPQLQIVCDSLYDWRATEGALTLEIYERLGTASQILAGYLERVLRRFNSADLQAAKEILTALISAEGERAVLRDSEISSRIRVEGEAAKRIIEELVAARIVRRRRQDGEAWLELAHDFLTDEVGRWLTAADVEIKRARAVIERAMENHRAHSLLIDADAVDLLLPFGESLGLTGEEADLLAASALARSRTVPEWLARRAPSMKELALDAVKNTDPEVRLQAVDAALSLRSPEMKEMLRKVSLWDEDLTVRKSASIALADWLGAEAEAVLSREVESEDADAVRRAISLAMIRDYDKRMVRFSHLSLAVAVLVFLALMWVRLRRGWHEIAREAKGGAAGGALSGLVGGLILGAGLASIRDSSTLEATRLILSLISMGTFIGGIGGLGVTLGMSASWRVAYRHSRWWSVVGGAAGGALVGGSSNLLGVDTLRVLFGQSPAGLTGAMEGAIIGAGVSLGIVVAEQLITRSRGWQRVVGACAGAVAAGVLLTVIGGNLFSGSLEIVAQLFANSQMRMETLANYFGEPHFGGTTQIVLGAMEGLLFGAGVSAGLEAASRAGRKAEEE
ncbi:MAG: winged helix-turn-helix domain-containing protein [Acidobacteriota bacterium]